MAKVAFYKGIRLWERLQGWTPSPAGGAGTLQGVTTRTPTYA